MLGRWWTGVTLRLAQTTTAAHTAVLTAYTAMLTAYTAVLTAYMSLTSHQHTSPASDTALDAIATNWLY